MRSATPVVLAPDTKKITTRWERLQSGPLHRKAGPGLRPRRGYRRLGALLAAALATIPVGAWAAGMSDMAGMGGMPAPALPAPGPHRWLGWREAQAYLRRSEHGGQVDRQSATVRFPGSRVSLYLIAVQPQHPDMSFELAGLVNPTLVVHSGARVTLHLLNMDSGPGMTHGVVITPVAPPYPALLTTLHPRLAVLAPLPPRSARVLARARYAEASVRFTAPAPGTYYYACQWPGHAQGYRMYGRLEVRGVGR